MKAMAPEIPARYQRAADVLEAVLAARARPIASRRRRRHRRTARPRRRPWRPAPLDSAGPEHVDDIQARLKAREAPQATVLLALPQGAPRAHRPVPVLRRGAVTHDAASFAGVKRFISADRRGGVRARIAPDAG